VAVVEDGEDYVFDCVYRARDFKVAVDRNLLENYDRAQDPRQRPEKFLIKRLPWWVGPFVMKVWDAGRRPRNGMIRLGPDDLGPALVQHPERRLRMHDLPTHDTPWDGSISLRREDMYGDDGR
jgi:hypothetical protein